MTIKGRQLFVGNLPFVAGWQDLKDLFRMAGNVQRANIMQGRDGRSKGIGIVLYATVADAQKAIATFDGYEWHGRKLEVREDRSAMDYPPPPPRTEAAANQQKQAEADDDGVSSTAPNEATSGEGSSPPDPSSPVELPVSAENSPINGVSLNSMGVNSPANGVSSVLQSEDTISNGTSSSKTNGTSTINGQRQLFVGNLPFRVRWQDMKDLFRKAGTVLRADVALGYDNRSKGRGTVLFATVEEAKAAINMFHNYSWHGRPLEVREDRGYVEPSDNDYRNDRPYSDNGSRRQSDSDASAYSQQSHYTHGAPMMPHGGMYYNQPRGVQPHQNCAGRLLFVGNLPFNCQWQDLKDLFRNAGNIIRADVSTNHEGRSRGFGTVLFATHEDAQNAVGMYNGYEYNGRTLRVHFDKFAPSQMPPHNPHPHMHGPPHHHHRHPPPMIPSVPHNFAMGPPPPMHHPHFLPAGHLGPFSPPLATPTLTSPPPFPPTYSPLAHMGTAPNSANAAAQFQPMTIVTAGAGLATSSQPSSASTQSTDTSLPATPISQFPGFGPIGKTHSPHAVASTTSALNGTSMFHSSVSGTANGINGSPAAGAEGDMSSVAAAFAAMQLNPSALNPNAHLFYHPAHPHHRPPIVAQYHHHAVAAAHAQHVAAAAAAHHHLSHQQQNGHAHSHHNQHPGAIGSGILGMGSNGYVSGHSNSASVSSTSSSTSGANGLSGVVHGTTSSGTVSDSETSAKGVVLGAKSSGTDSKSSANGSANGSTTTSGSTAPMMPQGLWGDVPANAAAMTIATLAGIALDSPTGANGMTIPAAQSVFVRNI